MPHTIQSMVYLYIRYGQYICIVWDIFLHTMGISLYNMDISLYCDSMGCLYIYGRYILRYLTSHYYIEYVII